MKKAKIWYLMYVGECPVCGRDKSYRVRGKGRKPARAKRYVWLSDTATYDHCIEREIGR